MVCYLHGVADLVCVLVDLTLDMGRGNVSSKTRGKDGSGCKYM